MRGARRRRDNGRAGDRGTVDATTTMRSILSTMRLRALRRIPAVSALAAALLGAVNVASALRPDLSWHGHLLLDLEPVETVRLLHAFALPAGFALLLLAPYLYRGRHRAWQAAIVLMVLLGTLDAFPPAWAMSWPICVMSAW